MDVTPTVPDGPDTELAAAEAWFRENTKAVDALALVDNAAPYQRHAATIVRAYLARPAVGRDLTARDLWRALPAHTPASVLDSADHVVARLNEVARPAVARTDGQPSAAQEEHGPFQVGETTRLEGTILRLRESLADVPAAIATVRDVWANGSPEARGFLRLPDAGSWPDLARALDTLCAISAGQKGSEHRAYEEWAAAQDADGQPPADEPQPSRWLVKDGPDSILGSFATRSAAEEAQERVRPAYPTAWVEEYPARSAAPADDTAAPANPGEFPTICWDSAKRIIITHQGDDVRAVENVVGHDTSRTVRLVPADDSAAPESQRGRVPDFGSCTPTETRFINAVAAAVAQAVDGHALFSRRYRVAGAALDALRAELAAAQPVRDSQDGGA